MTWGDELSRNRIVLSRQQFVDWLLSEEVVNGPMPYNPWLKALTQANGLREAYRRLGRKFAETEP